MVCKNCGANEWKNHRCAYCRSQHPDWVTMGWVDGSFEEIEDHYMWDSTKGVEIKIKRPMPGTKR